MSATLDAGAHPLPRPHPVLLQSSSIPNHHSPPSSTATIPQNMAPSIPPGKYSRVIAHHPHPPPSTTANGIEAPRSPTKSAFRHPSSHHANNDEQQQQRGRSHNLRTAAPNKENDPPSSHHHPATNGPSSPSKPSHGFSSAIARSKPIVDPKYRLRGNSPEDTQRTASGSRIKLRTASSSQSPSKGSRARSRSRSRLFGSVRPSSPPEVAPELETPKTLQEIDDDFLRLLDDMQVQPELRRKLLSLDSSVKMSMLKGQATLTLSGFGFTDDSTSGGSPTKSRNPIPPQMMRKTKSSANLRNGEDRLEPPNRSQIFGGGGAGSNSRSASGGSVGSSTALGSSSKNGTKRGSVDLFQNLRSGLKSPNLGQQGGTLHSLQSSSSGGSGGGGGTASGIRPRALSFGKDLTSSTQKETPDSFATLLKTTSARQLDVDRIKRMRAVMSSESPVWISQFVGPETGGYDAMLVRLDELLKMEWREEQHDDKLLHELLRCFVALSTTEVGRVALQRKAPTPFKELVELLFSEKKPGELPTRKVMVDLVALVLDLQLPSPTMTNSATTSPLNLLLQLLQNPIDPTREAVVDFIKQTHTPRPFKVYLTEVASVCRDYFWIFCHSQNRFWRFEELDVESIRTPKVPGGMTGGVEFEAMGYLTTHFRLINSISSALLQPSTTHAAPHPTMTALGFHTSLFASGLERILAHLRRSSQHYYSPLHLELARYISLATASGYRLPLHITDWLTPPTKVPEHQPIYQLGSLGTGYGFSSQFIDALVPVRCSSVEDQQRRGSMETSSDGAACGGGYPAPSAAAAGGKQRPPIRPTDIPLPPSGRSSPIKEREVSPPSPSKPYASGRWLAGGSNTNDGNGASKIAPPTSSPPLPQPTPSSAPTTTTTTVGGGQSPFPNPYELAPPRPAGGRGAEASLVGSAIKRWESRAAAATATAGGGGAAAGAGGAGGGGRSGLGLGWAPTSAPLDR